MPLPTPPCPAPPLAPGSSATPKAGRAWPSPQTVAATLVLVCLAGCSTPAPPPPAHPLGEIAGFRQAAATPPEALDAATWAGFGDSLLNELLAGARAANHDVRIALQRARQARAGSTATGSGLWPTVALTGSASDQRSGLPDEVKRGQPDTRAWRGALDLGWELDVFGAASAAAEGAALDALAAEAGVQAAQWLATTEVARHYLVWQGARLRLQQLQALLQAQQRTEALTRSRQAQGLASAFDLSRASAEVQGLAAQLPALHTLVAVSQHQIDVLLGQQPGAGDWAARQALAPLLPRVPTLAPGQPVELLQRRPDLRVAQQQLLAEAARLRASQAELWPGHPRLAYASIAPLPALGDEASTLARLRSLVEATPGARVVQAEGGYLRAEYTTPLMRYTDDVEFWFDNAAGVVQVRSASRLGYSDRGANRARVEALRQQLATAGG